MTTYAPQARRVLVQGDTADTAAVATRREVMSARSMHRPSIRNCQPSSRVMVASAVPLIRAARSRTHWKTMGGRVERNCPDGIARYVVLIASHIGTESVSRARRALSRAAPRAVAIEVGESGL